MLGARPLDRPAGLAILICAHVAVCCVSLWLVAHFSYPGAFAPARFHILFDAARAHLAILAAAGFAVVGGLFVLARFSFGYFAGFHLYTMVLGYLWLNNFSDLNYDHRAGGISAVISAVALLVPALFITKPLQQIYALSESALDRLLQITMLVSILTIVVAGSYNFTWVSLSNMYEFRGNLQIPTPVNYLIGITSSALLPFAFACFTLRGAYWKSAFTLVLMLLFYPITITKFALFTPIWLVFLTLLSANFRIRAVVVLSLMLPALVGILAYLSLNKATATFFATVNFRMMAIPSNVLDVYGDFFSRHDLTHFCQISPLKALMDCPYKEQLGIVMQKVYDLGNLNASLFATEGVASVGLVYAPISVFLCGLVLALGNRLSSGLPPRLVLLSGGVLPLILVNVPLSTALLTHGMGILFLLWYLTPRTILRHETEKQPGPFPRLRKQP